MNDRKTKPKKSLGQNFLIDKNIPAKIVRLSGVNKTCTVLEIGPGLGALTMPLAKAAEFVVAVELDRSLVDKLQNSLVGYSNVTVVQGDILKIDVDKLVKDTLMHLKQPLQTERDLHVCANLPYNITTPVLTKLIEARIFNVITIMVQKEVAQRICAGPGTPQYGAFTVFSNYYTKPEILFDVPPECFDPRPKVTSSVVRMSIRKEQLLKLNDEKLFFKVVRAAFFQRRKTLANALYAVFESTHNKEDIIKAIENCGFDVKIRGEKLGVDEFIKLVTNL